MRWPCFPIWTLAGTGGRDLLDEVLSDGEGHIPHTLGEVAKQVTQEKVLDAILLGHETPGQDRQPPARWLLSVSTPI